MSGRPAPTAENTITRAVRFVAEQNKNLFSPAAYSRIEAYLSPDECTDLLDYIAPGADVSALADTTIRTMILGKIAEQCALITTLDQWMLPDEVTPLTVIVSGPTFTIAHVHPVLPGENAGTAYAQALADSDNKGRVAVTIVPVPTTLVAGLSAENGQVGRDMLTGLLTAHAPQSFGPSLLVNAPMVAYVNPRA